MLFVIAVVVLVFNRVVQYFVFIFYYTAYQILFDSSCMCMCVCVFISDVCTRFMALSIVHAFCIIIKSHRFGIHDTLTFTPASFSTMKILTKAHTHTHRNSETRAHTNVQPFISSQCSWNTNSHKWSMSLTSKTATRYTSICCCCCFYRHRFQLSHDTYCRRLCTVAHFLRSLIAFLLHTRHYYMRSVRTYVRVCVWRWCVIFLFYSIHSLCASSFPISICSLSISHTLCWHFAWQ